MNIPFLVQAIGAEHRRAKEIIARFHDEFEESERSINLLANENVLSRTARAAIASSASLRYSLGRPSDRDIYSPQQIKGGLMLQSFPRLTELELTAVEAAKRMFVAAEVDFRPLSGLHATISTLVSFTSPDQTVFSIDPKNGGHAATRNILNLLGRKSCYLPWNDNTYCIDTNKLEVILSNLGHSAVVFIDHSTPLFPQPLSEVRLCNKNGIIIYDASHTLGLIAGQKFQKPILEGADIVQGNTHKTFPGPQKALVCFKDSERSSYFDNVLANALVSSSHTHHTASLAVTMIEMELFGAQYAEQVVANAQTLADWLDHLGMPVFQIDGKATESHIILLNGFKPKGAYRLCERLQAVGINTNARSAGDQEFVRIGVQEFTRRGAIQSDMRFIAEIIALANEESSDLNHLREDVTDIASTFTNVLYSLHQH